jgi:plastocyanin
MRLTIAILTLIVTIAMTAPLFAAASDPAQPTLTIKNKMFDPAELDVPAGQKIKITVKNEDGEAAEFESNELNREKVVPAHDQITVFVGPLDPGAYGFFNDFDPNKAKGKIIAK